MHTRPSNALTCINPDRGYGALRKLMQFNAMLRVIGLANGTRDLGLEVRRRATFKWSAAAYGGWRPISSSMMYFHGVNR